MEKLLLIGLLIASAGTGFSETSEIVNPPRPTDSDYKWLIVVKHSDGRDITEKEIHPHVHYFFADNYYVRVGLFETISWSPEPAANHLSYVLGLIGKFQHCVDFGTGCSNQSSDFLPFETELTLAHHGQITLVDFKVGKAPRRHRKSENCFGPITFVESEVQPTPQKAKVVFR